MLAILLFLSGSIASATSQFCARHFDRPSFATLAPYLPNQVVTANSIKEISRLATLQSSGDQVLMKLGSETTRWSRTDFADWQNLQGVIDHPQIARAEIRRIVNSEYCPAGILPALCRALRLSNAAARKSVGQTRKYAQPGVADFNYYMCLFHAGQDLLRFPWCRTTRSPELSEEASSRVFRLFAQESYLRHLEVSHPTRRLFTGKDLSLDTRLILAVVPALRPLAFWFLHQPLDSGPTMVYGSQTRASTALVSFHLRESGRPLVIGFLNPRVNVESLFHIILVVDGLRLEEREAWREYATARLRHYLAEFSRELDLPPNSDLRVKAGQTGFYVEFLNLRVDLQILFTYYLASQAAP